METDPTRICELSAALPEVTVLGVVDHAGEPFEVHIEQASDWPCCLRCGAQPLVKDRDTIGGRTILGGNVQRAWVPSKSSNSRKEVR